MGKTIVEELENFAEQKIVDNCEHLRKSGCDLFCNGCDCIIIRVIEALSEKEKRNEID